MNKREILLRKPQSAYERTDDGLWPQIEAFCEAYKAFLDTGRTERECVDEAVRQASALGYRPPCRENQNGLLYAARHGKAVMLVRKGTRPISDGLRIVAAHIDAPRIDLKPYPLYEKDGFAMLKTHYYGGIKKYQWLATPLTLTGVVILADGRKVPVDTGDTVLFISDILPHLGAEQGKKPLSEAFLGENMNVTAGTRPDAETGDDRIKLAVLSCLHDRYGMTEHDFQSAELCLVPAFKTRDAGLDKSMIAGYGHDDRVCSYAAMRALFDAKETEYTCVCILADKEEIGSEGITGMKSKFVDSVLEDLCAGQDTTLRDCYAKSFCLSGDVCNAFDPNFADVSDPKNNARLGFGPGVFKATGIKGKSGSSDASAETMARLRSLLDKAGIVWQMGELGKVDQGGGGTVAKFIAERNIEVVDIGVPVLNMHAPMEIVAKIDCWYMYKACLALFEDRQTPSAVPNTE